LKNEDSFVLPSDVKNSFLKEIYDSLKKIKNPVDVIPPSCQSTILPIQKPKAMNVIVEKL
jgi:hypothetical protein